jgi:hypothetical protein
MKKIMLVVLVSGTLFNLTALAQKIDVAKVPSMIKASFTKDFPGITATWEKEKLNYEANFKQSGTSMSALYDANGNRIETEKDVKIATLPAAVSLYITKNCKGGKIKEAAIITKANGEINYEAEVNGVDMLFTKDGKFIRAAKD